MERGSMEVRGTTDARLQRRAAAYTNAAPRMSGNIENCAAAWNAAACRTARHHGTRGSIHERGTMDERQHTSARQHYESAAARVRGTTYARPHSCAAAYMNAAP